MTALDAACTVRNRLPTDTTSLNTQSTFTPSSLDKPSTASSEDHSASKATVFKKKQTKKPTEENISELLSLNKQILKPPLKIDELIEHLTSNRNNIEVVNLSSTDFDQMLLSGKGTKDSSRVQ